MADTGFKFPSSTGFATSYGGSNEYTNPTNAYADDASYATRVDTDGFYHYQSYGNFGFSIPAGVVINGIEVVRKGKASAVEALDGINIYNPPSTSYFGDSGTYWGTTESENTLGSSTDLLGFTWSASDFADGSFHVLAFTGGATTGRTASLNDVKAKVYYTPIGGGFFHWFNDID